MQKKLSEYKSHSVLSSPEESRELLTDIEQLRKHQAEMLAKEQEANNRLKQLIAIVGTAPGQGSNASVLQSDRVFRQNLQPYSETKAKLADLLSKLAPNQPEVIAEKRKQQTLQSALLNRSLLLLGRPIDIKTLERLSVNIGSSGASWKSPESSFQELKQVKIERQKLRLRAKQIKQQIAFFESQLRVAQQELELNPQQDVLEEVFAATLAKSEMLVKPSLPEKSISPNLKLILLAILTQSQQWFTKTTQMATLVLLLGLTGGSWITNELLAPQIAHADTARLDFSLESQPNETYETLITRAEVIVQEAVQGNFEQNSQVTYVTVTVTAENQGVTAPVLSLEVSRTQWQKSPNIQRWGTYFNSARSLLGFKDVATTNSPAGSIATSVIAQQPINSFLSGVETDNPATTPNLASIPSTEMDSLAADVSLPVDPSQAPNTSAEMNLPTDATQSGDSVDSNPQQEFTVAAKLLKPQAKTARIDLSLQSQPNESYKTLLSRAEAAVQAAVQKNFEQNKQVIYVTAMVMAENYGEVAPLMSLEVSRSQWRKSPNIQRWGTYLTSARSLLGFEDLAKTNTSETAAETNTLDSPEQTEADDWDVESPESTNSSDPDTANPEGLEEYPDGSETAIPEASEESLDSSETAIPDPEALGVNSSDPIIAPSVTPE